jgi:hypothetical protein
VNTTSFEIVYVIFIVGALLGLAGYFGWRQWRTLRNLRYQSDLSLRERSYMRSQAWLRLVSSLLMATLAGLLIASYWLGQEQHARELTEQSRSAGPDGKPTPLDDDAKRFLTQYWTFWIIFALILFSLVSLAFIDIWTIRRFARQHLRQIQADRRAMIEHEVAQLRRQRNGF